MRATSLVRILNRTLKFRLLASIDPFPLAARLMRGWTIQRPRPRRRRLQRAAPAGARAAAAASLQAPSPPARKCADAQQDVSCHPERHRRITQTAGTRETVRARGRDIFRGGHCFSHALTRSLTLSLTHTLAGLEYVPTCSSKLRKRSTTSVSCLSPAAGRAECSSRRPAGFCATSMVSISAAYTCTMESSPCLSFASMSSSDIWHRQPNPRDRREWVKPTWTHLTAPKCTAKPHADAPSRNCEWEWFRQYLVLFAAARRTRRVAVMHKDTREHAQQVVVGLIAHPNAPHRGPATSPIPVHAQSTITSRHSHDRLA